MSRSDEYAAALRELDELKAAGKIDQAKWETTRVELLAELQRPARGWFYTVGTICGVLLVIVVVVVVLVQL